MKNKGIPRDSSVPAEDEVWTNFGSLPATIKGLENRFGELERASTKAR
jgi:hypothetical protein